MGKEITLESESRNQLPDPDDGRRIKPKPKQQQMKRKIQPKNKISTNSNIYSNKKCMNINTIVTKEDVTKGNFMHKIVIHKIVIPFKPLNLYFTNMFNNAILQLIVCLNKHQ